jgi:hypothetical protein
VGFVGFAFWHLELDAVDACAVEDEELVEGVATEAQVGDAGDSDEPQGFALVIEHCHITAKVINQLTFWHHGFGDFAFWGSRV